MGVENKMATIQITVPVNGNSNEMAGWLENISQHIDAGNNVEFIDSNSANVNISRLQLDTAGSVAVWGAGYAQHTAQRMYFTNGIIHNVGGIHGIDAAKTDKSIGIHGKI